jgi:hypothetical protein
VDSTLAGFARSNTTDLGALLRRIIDGEPDAPNAFAELVKHGEPAMQVIMARFPGPLRVDRFRTRDKLPTASQCGVVFEIIAAIGRPAVPYVNVRTTSGDPDVRFWATHMLGELRYPEGVHAVAARLFDEDASVRRIARRAAASILTADPGQKDNPILQTVEMTARNEEERLARRIMAIEAMGEIRLPAMVPGLIAVLADPSPEIAEMGRRALIVITRQDHGRDARKWCDFWAEHSSRHRIEWLIEALAHEQPSIRRDAADELESLTGQRFGYYDDLPKEERTRIQEQFRTWWDAAGRAKFAGGNASSV